MAALGASVSLSDHHDRIAGVLIVASVVIPTRGAWFLNVAVAVVGLRLVLTPRSVINDLTNEPLPHA